MAWNCCSNEGKLFFSSQRAHWNTRRRMDSNSSLDWPHLDLLNYNRTYKYLYLEGNVSYVDFYLHQPWVAAVFITSYLLIFLLCMVGNGGVCFIVLWSRHMRTVTNLFILNLAVSDLLVGLFCMPTTLLDNIIAGWPFGSLVCKMSGMVQGISVSASVFTLVAIAMDRFRCIVHPFKPKLTVPAAVATIAVIWALAVAIMCPSAALLRLRQEKRFQLLLGTGNATRPVFWCREEWPEPAMRKAYTTVLFANIYLAPLALIALLYARIGVSLCHAAVPAAGKRGREQQRGAWRRKRKAIHTLVLVTLLFALSWLPLWSLMLLSDYGSLSDVQLRLINVYIYPLAHWLAFSNSSVNPIIYDFCNRSFRRGFQAALWLQVCSRPACAQPAPGQAALPAAPCPPAQDPPPHTAKGGNWVHKQRDLLMEELKGNGTE
ncbi:neuropeptide FF receptor 2-like isoform X1 [Molothrus ater]|uniref:neuropeptide FF receptor 2-like isoform X1 n=2 Tax=Molothrus ater TaxID=84834 RepID=UPI00174C1E45|nr:neuropeptide FF receptor 2-like isoform X1 [Molothrus ater]XP_036237507.1 neuropeptide FF receptor 2-like isoform X1 [Molothrus ater]